MRLPLDFSSYERDPRDIYCSYKGINDLNSDSAYKPVLSNDIESFTADWLKNQTMICDAIANFDSRRCTIISYEDLVRTPKEVLTKLCVNFNIPFDTGMLNYFNTNDEPKALLAWKLKTLQPPDLNSVGRYKNLLSEEESQFIIDNTFVLYKKLKDYSI